MQAPGRQTLLLQNLRTEGAGQLGAAIFWDGRPGHVELPTHVL